MTTFKASINRYQRSDGRHHLRIRVTHNRVVRYIPTTFYVTRDDFTRSYKLKNQFYIDQTNSIISSYIATMDRIGMASKHMDIDTVIDVLTRNDRQFRLNFFDYGNTIIERTTREGRTRTAIGYKTALNSLAAFLNTRDVDINSITYTMVVDWINSLQGKTVRTIYTQRIKALFNFAANEFNDEDSGVINIRSNPFNKIRIEKLQSVNKRALTKEQLQSIFSLDTDNPTDKMAVDAFMLSFCLCGMNAKDLYECPRCDDGRISYCRAKTKRRRSDNAYISLAIQPEISGIVARCEGDSVNMFNFRNKYSSVTTFNTSLSVSMRRIGKRLGIPNLTFYSARHSWATLAVNDCGIDTYIVHQALNHSSVIGVTDVYIKKSWKVLDDANRKILDYVFGYSEN